MQAIPSSRSLPRPALNALVGLAALALSSCATPARGPVATGPGGLGAEIPIPGTAAAERSPILPPIPDVDGDLALEVGYPPEGATLAVRDRNFIFGSTGSGRTTLTINGTPVPVAPNGGFLAFLPVPPDGVYRLVAVRDGQEATLERTVGLPPTPPTLPAGLSIVPGSATPSGAVAALPGERIEVGFRGTPGGSAALVLADGTRIPLVEVVSVSEVFTDADQFRAEAPARESSPAVRFVGILPARPLFAADSTVALPTVGSFQPVGGGPPAASGAWFELVLGGDTVRTDLRLNVAVVEPERPLVAVATPPSGAARDWRSRGRNDIAGPFHYFWPPGTRMEVVGERNGMLRVRLAGERTAWVPAGELQLLPPGAPPPNAVIPGARLNPEPTHIDVRIPLTDRLPFQVLAEERALHLDVFGATSRTNFFQYGRLDPLVERAEWSQPLDGVYRVSIWMSEPVWGYDTFFDAAGTLVLRIRRPPAIDPSAPMRGLRVVVDPGHGGADRATRGPTGFTEADANLAISLALGELLRARGAEVILTRSEDETVPLGDRPLLAVDRDAHLLVSVHNNAFPDGVDPWANAGTSVYYFHPHSADFAAFLQLELLEELGLRDIGIGRADLALVRPTWMPSALTETMYMMIPEQEAALRDPEVQERVAAAHLRAIEEFLRVRARR